MKNKTKVLLILLSCILFGFLLGLLVGSVATRIRLSNVKVKAERQEEIIQQQEDIMEEEQVLASESSEKKQVIYGRKRLPYAKLFNDLNETHLELARKVGLKSIPKTRADISRNSNLVEIRDNQYFVLYNLKYSVPFLTKGAAKELNEIAKAFSDSLENKHLLDYKLMVTSVLRTEEDVHKLRRSGNYNATENSAHCYGTTFDIAYTRYHRDVETDEVMEPFELTKVLGEVLLDRKKAGKCLVKYEKVEHCFHITSCY
ncbi:MAG: DUF5715 family protein [Candidatus Cryptobacteroides sp.]